MGIKLRSQGVTKRLTSNSQQSGKQSLVKCVQFLAAGLLGYKAGVSVFKKGYRKFWLGSWNTLGLSPCFPQEEIKLRNKLNFSDTASACFLVRNIFDSFEYVLYYPYDLYELSKGFTSSRLFTADTWGPFLESPDN